ncbi:MAG: flagellar biosynthesis anti-sigma factor FlgM [Planctomycetaceae bacterium]|nr:flagellar biosynthesis anti-sigma factor FlgM [Planctomycetaceae bacterium]
MNIYGSPFVQNTHSVSAPQTPSKSRQTAAPESVASSKIQDEVSLSNAARQLTGSSPQQSGEIRFDLVNRIRSEIAAGTYETPEKLDAALEKMLAGIGY